MRLRGNAERICSQQFAGLRSAIPVAVCLPQIKPEHIGDAIRPGSDGTECAPLPRRHVISARPCSTISEYACHYSSPCRTAAHGADGVRRTPRYDRGVPCGSSRSTVLHMRFARVNARAAITDVMCQNGKSALIDRLIARTSKIARCGGHTVSCDASQGSNTILPPSPPASIRA
jgi:hypothetical protein